jgi:hypothetical protein
MSPCALSTLASTVSSSTIWSSGQTDRHKDSHGPQAESACEYVCIIVRVSVRRETDGEGCAVTRAWENGARHQCLCLFLCVCLCLCVTYRVLAQSSLR